MRQARPQVKRAEQPSDTLVAVSRPGRRLDHRRTHRVTISVWQPYYRAAFSRRSRYNDPERGSLFGVFLRESHHETVRRTGTGQQSGTGTRRLLPGSAGRRPEAVRDAGRRRNRQALPHRGDGQQGDERKTFRELVAYAKKNAAYSTACCSTRWTVPPAISSITSNSNGWSPNTTCRSSPFRSRPRTRPPAA